MEAANYYVREVELYYSVTPSARTIGARLDDLWGLVPVRPIDETKVELISSQIHTLQLAWKFPILALIRGVMPVIKGTRHVSLRLARNQVWWRVAIRYV